MDFCILASGSTADSVFISIGRTRVLIGAGLSRRKAVNRLAATGERGLETRLVVAEHGKQTEVIEL